MIGWSRFIAPKMQKRNPVELAQAVAAIPTEERRRAWNMTIHNQFNEADLQESSRRLLVAAARLNDQLGRTPWLAGATYSLADINVFNMAAALPAFMPGEVNLSATPHLVKWIEKVAARPAVRAALAYSRNSLRKLD
jgi:glutathione S-transferase/GST-like protein